jgi:hypothetical protein
MDAVRAQQGRFWLITATVLCAGLTVRFGLVSIHVLRLFVRTLLAWAGGGVPKPTGR